LRSFLEDMHALDPADIQCLEMFLASARRITIVVHTHPDGDAVGSGVGMLAYLRQCRGRDARLLLPDTAPASLAFALPADGVIDAARDPEAARVWIAGSDLLVCQDLNGFSRTGDLAAFLQDSHARKVLVDHHLTPERASFDLVFSETEISSTCELLYRVLLALPGVGTADRLPLCVLTSLMTGMTTDTNNFANSVFPSTLQMASELLAAGVDRDALIDQLYHSYRENRLRAMGACLQERMHITPEGVAFIVLDRSFMERFELQDGETEGFVNLPLGIGRVRLSLLLREDDGHFRVSIRSKEGVSANRLAVEVFHGGGHERAAGGKLYFPQDIAGPAQAEGFLEDVAARFMRKK
jgi:phosphoesterase RecJ-like protein